MFKTEKSAAAIQTNLAAIFVSMELSRSTWLITTLLPGTGEKMSKYPIAAGNTAGLFDLFAKLQERSRARTGRVWPIITIQEAGLDGFWVHRALVKVSIESHIVDAASIATPRKRRRVKTDRVDGETLLRVLLAFKRGEPRVCSMVRDISHKDEDRRRIGRERKALMVERVAHVNRIKGLLFSQGINDYEPLHKDRRQRLEELRTGDGQTLPPHMKAQICRELDRLELVIRQIRIIEDERDALIAAQSTDGTKPSAVTMLLRIKGIGAEFANIIWSEGLFRHFENRRQVAAYAGLAPTPWQSGSVNREQGVSKAGNPGLRTTLIQLSWLWLRHQPDSTLAKWFTARIERNGGRMKKTAVVALARKLLVALWKYVNFGVVIEGAVMKTA
ncbi:IS110 family transposase [Sinorhizobium alkalisoli]|uniref:Transposase n=1 Tax=Sinorhizobium alkalisoli TaxID=1752398 RepID=A0A1E3V7T9_9HYPH|nr:IS110 family transposase [Sinorhizobium alkalisoli]MCG5480349.1 IS110 family transposase [Sinorhizobium alkalisoli]ODR89589.1 transposase [Sinorhizobium alkalisoli]